MWDSGYPTSETNRYCSKLAIHFPGLGIVEDVTERARGE